MIFDDSYHSFTTSKCETIPYWPQNTFLGSFPKLSMRVCVFELLVIDFLLKLCIKPPFCSQSQLLLDKRILILLLLFFFFWKSDLLLKLATIISAWNSTLRLRLPGRTCGFYKLNVKWCPIIFSLVFNQELRLCWHLTVNKILSQCTSLRKSWRYFCLTLSFK